ncbi:MAG TPA: hypothetical protein VKB88_45350 [Bryobacteraceae bacterium]|nr:hypothetical protein [Bryobacteraceae bacterium]
MDSARAAPGWQRVASGGDAVVSAFGRTGEPETLQTYYDGRPGWGWRGMAPTEAIPEQVGNLTADLCLTARRNSLSSAAERPQ